jgi:hypothetical protein
MPTLSLPLHVITQRKTVFVTIEFDFPNTISMQLSMLELFLWDDNIKITLGNRT